MDNKKQIELIRKRNAELNKQLEMMREQLIETQTTDDVTTQLISDLTSIKEQWLEALEGLNEQKAKYDNLIAEARNVQKEFLKITQDAGVSVPISTRIKMKLKK